MKKVGVYCNFTSMHGFDMDCVLNKGITFRDPQVDILTDAQIIDYTAKKLIDKAKVEAWLQEQYGQYGDTPTLNSYEIVVLNESRWYKGEYYAHEYGKYVPGRIRKLEYTNGFVEFEVECLDKTLNVLDGIWRDYHGNGFGDSFELLERTTWS